jgi:hypothetical protein
MADSRKLLWPVGPNKNTVHLTSRISGFGNIRNRGNTFLLNLSFSLENAQIKSFSQINAIPESDNISAQISGRMYRLLTNSFLSGDWGTAASLLIHNSFFAWQDLNLSLAPITSNLLLFNPYDSEWLEIAEYVFI